MRNRLIVCVGFRGSGKSSVAAAVLRSNDGLFVYDPHGDEIYDGLPNTARSVAQLEDYARWWKEAHPKRTGIRYIPDARLDPYKTLDDFCAWISGHWKNVWVCVEEVSDSCNGVAAQGMPGELRRIVNQGRHQNLNQIYCGLRYSEIPRPITAGADVQFVFSSQEPIDLEAMKIRIGEEATDEVQELGEHQALVFFRDRTWTIAGSRDANIPELALLDSAPDSEEKNQ